MKEFKNGLYVMAKEAHHKLGDVSRKDWDLAIVEKEDDKNFYGRWATGFGFIGVKFPKISVRELTKKEVKKYNGTLWGINGIPINKLDILDSLWKKDGEIK